MAYHLLYLEYMTAQEITTYYNRIIGSLDNKELKNAFDALLSLIAGTKEYLFTDKVTELHNTYKYMLRYRTEGIKDPMQQRIYNNILISAYELSDDIKNKIQTREAPAYYYSRKRVADHTPPASYKELSDILQLSEGANEVRFDEALAALFQKVWISDRLSPEDSSSLQSLVRDEGITYITVCQIVSALTLSLQFLFDEKKLMLLFDAANQTNDEIRIRAIIGILLTLYVYRKRISLYPKIQERLDELAEEPGFVPLLRTIILKFILSRETEKISRKLQNEILPEMMKLTPKLNKKLNLQDPAADPFNTEMNPEWQNEMKNSGLEDKLKEFTELQMEGADVMHSSFIHLKSYPFFSEIGNWFLPFMSGHSAITGNKLFNEKDTILLETLTGSSFICNSDKYSIYFSMMSIPSDQRAMIANQLSGEAAEFMKQKKEELDSRLKKEETIIGQYIQDLYRFYKIHPHHLSFDDIFSFPLDFHNLPVIKPYISDTESLRILAEYYLRKEYYDDALVLYNRLSENMPTDAVLFQKIGYCLEMTQSYVTALEAYLHADLLDGNSKWTLRHIGKIYRSLSQADKALPFYKRLESMDPENLSVQINIGHCYLELKDYSEALKYFFKADYLNGKSSKAWRPIAWCSFVTGKYEQAQNYYRKILDNNPTDQDFLNAGHTEWVLKNVKEAIRLYVQAVHCDNGNFHKFNEQFRQDIPELLSAGIEDQDIPLILDQIRYKLEEV